MPYLESLGSIPLAATGVSLLLAAALGLGSLVIRSRYLVRWRRVDALLLQLVTGINLLGAVGVVLGMLGLPAGIGSLALLGTLTLLGALAIRPWRRIGSETASLSERRSGRTTSRGKKSGRGTVPSAIRLSRRRGRWYFRAVFLVLILATLGPALCYPTGWDELVYQQELPRRWLADGGLEVYPDLPYSGFPSLGPVLFWLIGPVENVIAPRLLVWVCWLIGLFTIYRLLERYVSPQSAAVLVLAFSLNDTSLVISANCYVETIQLMNVSALLLTVRQLRRREPAETSRTVAAMLGVLAGGTASVKLTGCAALILPCLWYLGEAWRNRAQRRTVAVRLGIFAATAVCLMLPFYLRPWLATGNPFYPYLCQWFTLDINRLEMSSYQHAIGGHAFGVKGLVAFASAPLLLAFRHENFDGEFGWQLILLLVLAIVALASAVRVRSRYAVLWPAATSAWLYIFWFVTAQQARFAIPILAAFLPLAGLGVRRLHRHVQQFALSALVALAVISVPWNRTEYYVLSWLTVVGKATWTEYVDLVTRRTYLPLIDAIVGSAPEDAKLMLLFEHRGFYFPREHVIGTPLFQEGPFTPPERYSKAAPVMEALHQMGISHLVIAKSPAGPDHVPEAQPRHQTLAHGIDECVQRASLRLVWESDAYIVLQVQ